MAKNLRYGKKTYKPDRTLALASPKTLATTTSKALVKKGEKTLFPSEKAARTPKGGSLSTFDANGQPISPGGSASGGKGKKGGGRSIGSGGSMASRTDEEEEEGGTSSAQVEVPKGVVRSSAVVQMLIGLGLDKAAAVQLALRNQLSQSNPRVGSSGLVSRRAGGAGFGRGQSSGAKPKRTKTATPSPDSPKGKPLALPDSPKGKPLALPDSPKGKPLALPDSPKGKPLALPGKASAISAEETAEQIANIPPSLLRAQATGIIRSIEDVVRTIFEPVEMSAKKSERAQAAIKTAAAAGEVGKVLDLVASNAIEFETPEERKKTFSWLERMIRKIQ